MPILPCASFSGQYEDIRAGIGDLASFNERYRAIIKGDVENKNINGRWEYGLKTDDGLLNMHQASSGQKEAFPLLATLHLLRERKDSELLILIEEPEAHLFPKDQDRILKAIVEYINQTDSKVIITTHSPYILAGANNLLEAEYRKSQKYKETWINIDDINAHSMKADADKTIQSLIKDRLIDGDYIESVSYQIMEEYNAILAEGEND